MFIILINIVNLKQLYLHIYIHILATLITKLSMLFLKVKSGLDFLQMGCYVLIHLTK